MHLKSFIIYDDGMKCEDGDFTIKEVVPAKIFVFEI